MKRMFWSIAEITEITCSSSDGGGRPLIFGRNQWVQTLERNVVRAEARRTCGLADDVDVRLETSSQKLRACGPDLGEER